MKWRLKEKPTGDAAHYREVFDDVIVDGYVEDCDGDYITWSVRENGNKVAGGDIVPKKGKTLDSCWIEAMASANKVIAINPKAQVVAA